MLIKLSAHTVLWLPGEFLGFCVCLDKKYTSMQALVRHNTS